MEFPKTALILAAGFGKRMKSLCKDLPKPLLIAEGKTLLEWQVINLSNAGIKNIGINIHHEKDKMFSGVEYLTNKYKNINFFTSFETPNILGQAGGIATLLEKTNDDFFLSCNCDSFVKLKPMSVDQKNISLLVEKADGSLPGFNKIVFKENTFEIVKDDSNNKGYYYSGYMFFHRSHISHLPTNQEFHVVESMWKPHHEKLKPIELEKGEWLDVGEEDKFVENSQKLPSLLGI